MKLSSVSVRVCSRFLSWCGSTLYKNYSYKAAVGMKLLLLKNVAVAIQLSSFCNLKEGVSPQVEVGHHASDVLTVEVIVRFIDVPYTPGSKLNMKVGQSTKIK